MSGSGAGPGASSECRGPALFVPGPGAPCVGARRCWVGVGARPSSPGALSVRARRSVSGPNALCVGARRFVSWPGALRIGARRSLCRGLVRHLSVVGRRSLFGGRRSLCRGPALSVGARRRDRRSLCRAPALFVSARHSLYLAAAISVRVCLEPGLFLYRSLALFGALCRGPTLSYRAPAISVTVCLEPGLFLDYARRSPTVRLCRAAAGPSSRATAARAPSRVPPIRHRLRSACHPSSPARSLFPGENPKPYCLGE